MLNADNSYIVIERIMADGQTEVIHRFGGDKYDEVIKIHNRMKRLYASLPEFAEEYFLKTYAVRRYFFDDPAKVLDSYPAV